MPGISQTEILKDMNQLLDDSRIVVSVMDSLVPNKTFPLNPEVMQIIEQVTEKQWPGVPVIPVMDVGASDGIYMRSFGIPTYGVSGVFIDEDDNRAHGKDERISVKNFYDGFEYEYELIKAFSR